jgi:hypothetical protein
MITLEEGRIKTCLLPAFSALVIVLRASARTELRVIFFFVFVLKKKKNLRVSIKTNVPKQLPKATSSNNVHSVFISHSKSVQIRFSVPEFLQQDIYSLNIGVSKHFVLKSI